MTKDPNPEKTLDEAIGYLDPGHRARLELLKLRLESDANRRGIQLIHNLWLIVTRERDNAVADRAYLMEVIRQANEQLDVLIKATDPQKFKGTSEATR